MKTYNCICHVCGKHHIIETDFLSTIINREEDGVGYPMLSCGKHTQQEVKCAYEKVINSNGI